jgi:MoaA/NifB/PqqE/SkfB family radical SAM enzyme
MAPSCNYPAIPVIKDLAFREGIPLRLDWRLTPRWDGKPHSPGLALRPEEKQEILRLSGGSRGEESWPEPLTVNPVFESPGCNAGASICYLTPQADVWPCIEIPHPWGRYPAVTGFLEFWQKGVRRDEFQAIFEGVSAGERPCDHFWKCQPTDGIAKVIHESSMG